LNYKNHTLDITATIFNDSAPLELWVQTRTWRVGPQYVISLNY